MYNFLVKNGQGLAFGLGLLITVVFLVFVLSGMEEFSALPDEERSETSIFDFGLRGALVLAVIAAIAMVGFGLFHILSNFRSSVKGIIGVVALIGIFIVAYSMAPMEPDHNAIAEAADRAGGISDNQMKFIGGAITTAVVLTGLAAAAFVVSELRNFFK